MSTTNMSATVKLARQLDDKHLQEILSTLQPTEDSKIEELLDEVMNLNAAERKKFEKKIEQKDPNLPKRFTGAYFYYSNAALSKVKEDNKDLTHQQAIKVVANQWNNLSDAEKKPFLKLEKKDRARYEQEMKDYTPSEGFTKKKAKDPNRIKKYSNAYIHFTREKRPELHDIASKDIMAEMGKLWKALSEEDRVPYVEQAKAEKEAYEKKISKAEKKREEKNTDKKRRSREEVEEEEDKPAPRSVKKSKKTEKKSRK
jgi:HMG (high mobility group) box